MDRNKKIQKVYKRKPPRETKAVFYYQKEIMSKKLQGVYRGNVGSLIGNIYLQPKRARTQRRKIIVNQEESIKRYKQIFQDMFSAVTNKASTKITVEDHLNNIRVNYSEEVRKNGEQTKIEEGFVYLICSDSYPGWIKAGMTIDYERRLESYNLYHPEKGFRYLKIKWVQNRRKMEKILLEELEKISDKVSGEWFKVDAKQASSLFD